MDDWKLKVWVVAQFANKHSVHKAYKCHKCHKTIHSEGLSHQSGWSGKPDHFSVNGRFVSEWMIGN